MIRRAGYGLLLVLLVVALGQGAFGGQPIAFLACGGSGPYNTETFAGNRTFKDGCVAAAQINGPKLKAAHYTRLMLHNPGGTYALGWIPDSTNARTLIAGPLSVSARELGVDTRLMHINQWLLAEQCHAPWANRDQLRQMHDLFRNKYGIGEVIYYLGAPSEVPLWLAQKSVEPFVGLPGVSLAFDHVCDAETFAKCEPFFRWLRFNYPHVKIYTEARPFGDVDPRKVRGLIDGTVAKSIFDEEHPDLLARAGVFGEVIQLSRSGTGLGPEVTPLLKNWK